MNSKPGEVPPGVTFRFEGEKLAIGQSNGAAKPGSRLHIEPFATPKEIDITDTSADKMETTILGIYRLDKGQLFISLDRKNPARRPNGYVTGLNSGIEIMTLERAPRMLWENHECPSCSKGWFPSKKFRAQVSFYLTGNRH